jgi:hypothetical protein
MNCGLLEEPAGRGQRHAVGRRATSASRQFPANHSRRAEKKNPAEAGLFLDIVTPA